MSSGKLSKKEHLAILEHTIVNHSFIIDALIYMLVENGVCSLDDIKRKMQQQANNIENEIKENTTKTEDETPVMVNYFGPIGEA